MKTSPIIYILSVTSMLSHARSYRFPKHVEIESNNYEIGYLNQASKPTLYNSLDQLSINDVIMVYDRYQSLYKEVSSKLIHQDEMLARLDRVKVIGKRVYRGKSYVKVKVISTVGRARLGSVYFTRIKGLSKYESYKHFDKLADVYMVQNIATEKLRVYQRLCKDLSCPAKLIFETDFVAGYKKRDQNFEYRTHVGNYRIFEWVKFYQDKSSGGHYPSWYDPEFPQLPDRDDSWSKWFDDDLMPWKYCQTKSNGKRKCSHKEMIRGAFGWYTALVEPHYQSGQWTHGTIGWAQSSIDNIKRAKGEDLLGGLASLFTSLRSSGCSRVSNPAIAFLRHILPIGTPLIKIYALEKYQDQHSMDKQYKVGEQKSWNFALTKDGVRQVNEQATSSHLNYVLERGYSNGEILEQGTFTFNTYPSVVQYSYDLDKLDRYNRPRKRCKEVTIDSYRINGPHDRDKGIINPMKLKRIRSKQCNVYGIKADKFRGVFYTDTGVMESYQHPDAAGIIVSGFKSQAWPRFFDINNYK